MDQDQSNQILEQVKQASTKWKSAFNNQDANGCAMQYEENAIMHARPFGTFTGREEIRQFWQKLMDDGFNEVDYIDPKIEVIDENSAILRSGWKMNKAKGVIHKELWVLQTDGTAKLREDDFEATG